MWGLNLGTVLISIKKFPHGVLLALTREIPPSGCKMTKFTLWVFPWVPN
jgi:hypothetical protein